MRMPSKLVASGQAQAHYVMELFNVELGSGAQSRVEADPANRSLTEAEEVQASQIRDGEPVSATMKRLREAIRERIA